MSKPSRTPPERFAFSDELLRSGFFSDKYFLRTQHILTADAHQPTVLMQVFCRSRAVLCGVDEALALLRRGTEDWSALRVHALHDGDEIQPWETVLTIEGPYHLFAHLETAYLGVLARGSRVATQTRDIVTAAGAASVLFFGARHDHPGTQMADGYAALVAGAAAVASDAQGHLLDRSGVGTIPHGLIAAYGGDTLLAAQRFLAHMPKEVALVALVDFDNDCVGTSLRLAHALGERLRGVRLDTSNSLVDATLAARGSAATGVNPELVEAVRTALDGDGFGYVEIVVSGGLTAERVQAFVESGAAVDAFGVGSSILRNAGGLDFTADIVRVDDKPLAKVGRRENPNPRLQEVD